MIAKRIVIFCIAVFAIWVEYSNNHRELQPFDQAKDLTALLPFLAESEVRGCVVSRGRSYVTVERCYMRREPVLQTLSDHLIKEGWVFSNEDASTGTRIASWCKGNVDVTLSSENGGWTVELSKAPANSCK